MEITAANESVPVTEKDSSPAKLSPAPSPVDKTLRWVTSILLLIFPTATLFLNRGDSYVLGILILIGIWVWFRDGARRWLDRPAALLWITFALFFAVALLSYLVGTQTDGGFRFLGRYLRFLLVVPVYLALRRYPPTAKTVFIGLALGALLAGVIGSLHFLHADSAIRVEATTGLSIIFGDLATTMTLCAVAAFALLGVSRRKWAMSLLVLCVVGGVVATLLSGTRGAWIPLWVLPLLLVVWFGGAWKARYIIVILLLLVAVFSSFYLVAHSTTRTRIVDAGENLRNYFVALQYVDAPGNGISKRPVCVNAPNFLRAWLNAGRTMSGTLDAVVMADPRLGHVAGCLTDYAVRLQNPDDKQAAQRILIRVPDREVRGQHAVMLMRGQGTMTFAGGEVKPGASINTREYQLYSIANRTAPGNLVNVFIAPGRAIWLVPLDGYPGEYSLSIADNAVGQRLEMWRAAWKMFVHRPLLGVGTGAYQDKLVQLIQGGEISPFVDGYDHPHSDYFNALASAGIIGFLTLLAILLVPLVRFWRALHSKDAVSHAVGLAGALTVLGFAIYALTDTIFLHSMMITWYVVYMALFYALLDAQTRKLVKPEPPKQ